MSSQPTEEAGFKLVVAPQSSRFDRTDNRWRKQVGLLYADLRRDVGDVRMEDKPSPGNKGAATDVILALGSSGALTAAVTMFRAWLGRDHTRALEISWTEGDQQRTRLIRATDIDDEVFNEIARAFSQDFVE